MTDGVQDKVIRNVVTLSAFIIVTAFLGLKVEKIDKHYGLEILKTVSKALLIGGGDPVLLRWANIGVSNAIYNWFPVNYKVLYADA